MWRKHIISVFGCPCDFDSPRSDDESRGCHTRDAVLLGRVGTKLQKSESISSGSGVVVIAVPSRRETMDLLRTDAVRG